VLVGGVGQPEISHLKDETLMVFGQPEVSEVKTRRSMVFEFRECLVMD
jgi:hypothetical protein